MNTTIRQADVALRNADIICHCKGISRAEILAAADLCGGDTGAVARATGAGSVCGGCTPRLGQILGQDTMVAARLVEKEALDATHFRLVFRAEQPFATTQAGADIALNVPVGGSYQMRSYTATRLADHEVEITVRREPNGLVSRWLTDMAREEDAFEVSQPFGGLAFAPSAQPVFLAAGIGITPALAFARARPTRPAKVVWWVRGSEAPGLVEHVRRVLAETNATLELHDTSAAAARLRPETARDWIAAHLSPEAHIPHLCGPQGFLETVVGGLDAVEWPKEARRIASFVYAPGQGTGAAAAETRHTLPDFRIPQDAVTTESFHLRPAAALLPKLREAQAFLKQFYHEVGAATPFPRRMEAVTRALRRTGTYTHTGEELAYGARLAWRNSNRCIGRFFWQSLAVNDERGLGGGLSERALAQKIFDALLSHIAEGTNGGDLRPAITVFAPGQRVFIENGQLILYAGHERGGDVIGDPKNVELTRRAKALGWRGAGTPFDILPLLISIDGGEPHLFEVPEDAVLEVPISHPESAAVGALGLKWFALPAVANMALDLGGIVYGAAPSNGFYMGTEIGSFNLGDPKRYDQLPAMARALGLEQGEENPLWRDQA
ncbi:MAG: nitric oxide synthase oxygenase, partial [Pseudomonadota bacterium]